MELTIIQSAWSAELYHHKLVWYVHVLKRAHGVMLATSGPFTHPLAAYPASFTPLRKHLCASAGKVFLNMCGVKRQLAQCFAPICSSASHAYSANQRSAHTAAMSD